LSEIIGRRVRLTRAGREFKGCCPFHNEKTASFTVNDEKQFYHCFGCGAHGDAIDFVMQHDNRNFIEALKLLAEEAGMEVPEQTPQEAEKENRAHTIRNILEAATDFFEESLKKPGNKAALKYLKDRGLADETIASFRLGYAVSDGQAIRTHLKSMGYTDEDMISAGILSASTKGGEPYSFFRERVMFPVSDRRGRVVAFGGRILPEHLRPPQRGSYEPPKYINSRDTDLFHKGRMLYGESHARQAARDNQPLIVVEGYLDSIACSQAGWSGAVAPLGTALTEEQIGVLWNIITLEQKIPVLCFDGDKAGKRAAVRAAERVLPLLKPNHSISFAFLPEDHDPDSLIRMQGSKAFEAVIDSAMPLVDFIWLAQTEGRKFDTPESMAGLSKSLEDTALRISDRGVQQYYMKAFKDKVWKKFRKPSWKGKPSNVNRNLRGGLRSPFSGGVRSPAFSGEIMQQQILLASIINHPELFEAVEEALGSLVFSNERLDSLRQIVLNLLGGDSELDSEGLIGRLYDSGYREELEIILSDHIYTHAGFARSDNEIEEVKKGWNDTIDFLHKRTAQKELQEAGRALIDDFSKENERVMLSMVDVNKVVEN
jgi:DNA primase